MKLSAVIRGLAASLLIAVTGQTATAQNLFAPVARVDDTVVTEYEVQQRQRFLQLLNAPDSDRESVVETLIDDRLRNKAVSQAGIVLTSEDLQRGLEDFAGRANLTVEEFSKALAQQGVDSETLRDFVANSLGWRELIRGLYLNRVQVSPDEINRALADTASSGSGIRVLLSEIIIPAPPQNAARVNALADRISQSRTEGEFSSFARQYSATASRGRGGRMPWTPLENLPPQLRPIILALAPGEVTSPLPIPNAVALFQLRGIEETGTPAKTYAEIEYAAYYIPGGRSEAALAAAAKVRDNVDVCDDLYGIAKGQPEEVLERTSKKPGEIPQDIAIELAKLDAGESSVALTRNNGQTLMFLMLCGRKTEANAEATREEVVNALRQRKLQGYADVLMTQLRANARIIRQ